MSENFPSGVPFMDSDILENYLVSSRGGDASLWRNAANRIAFHESGPQQRMSPTARQISSGGGRGPGRGMFQFEDNTASGSFDTAKKRYKNILESVQGALGDVALDPEILEAENADELNENQQRALFYANLIEGPAKLSDYVSGKLPLADLWLQGHKGVEKKGNRESFAQSMRAADRFDFDNTRRTVDMGDEMVQTIMNSRQNGGRIGKKIKVLKKEGRPHDQAVAIALSMRDRGQL
jgi:hypothetical protein|tara:strand:- start:81 stop:791 length:711 start_codon:yes stop_codon:yes gene_type:complete